MTITVYRGSLDPQSFEDVSGFTFYSGRNNNTGLAIARWTKYGEESGSEDFVNLDPSALTVTFAGANGSSLEAYVKDIDALQCAAPDLEAAVQLACDAIGPLLFNLNESQLNPDQRQLLKAYRACRAVIAKA